MKLFSFLSSCNFGIVSKPFIQLANSNGIGSPSVGFFSSGKASFRHRSISRKSGQSCAL